MKTQTDMELYIAGGCGEHGRNCFLVRSDSLCFLVDCGIMAGNTDDPYPHLSSDQIRKLDYVFLTHSHSDHSGALPWLLQQGFGGTVVASSETLRQLPFTLPKICPLQDFHIPSPWQMQWGRSGHCTGSVWFRFSQNEKSILFSGDYTENTLVYACDPIRGQTADVAVLDCAYGRSTLSYESACEHILKQTESFLSSPTVLFPVPKYGRGLELLKLLTSHFPDVAYYGDRLFLENVHFLNSESIWCRPADISQPVSLYAGQTRGIIFVSDPQLRTVGAREIAGHVLSSGGKAIMTGTPERGGFSEQLLLQGNMVLFSYPVHLQYAEYEALIAKNKFGRTIPYHSPELPVEGSQPIIF